MVRKTIKNKHSDNLSLGPIGEMELLNTSLTYCEMSNRSNFVVKDNIVTQKIDAETGRHRN